MIWHTIIIVESTLGSVYLLSYSECHYTVFCFSRLVGVMGGSLKKIFGKKEVRILLLGLDAAGKTSIPSQCVNEFITHNTMI